MKNLFKMAGLLVLAGAVAAAIWRSETSDARCLSYRPATVTLAGKLVRKTYPGPPNFESVAKGDEAETGYYLQLNEDICTRAGEDDDESEFDAEREVQLVLTDRQYKLLRPSLGKNITLDGELFSAFSGHHHANLLLIVKEAP